MKNIIGPILLGMILCSTAVAETIAVVSTGSKTGSYSMQSVAYASDLEQSYNSVDLIMPGGHCQAIAILDKIEKPVIFPWASDFEAIGRDGIGCATLNIADYRIIRYNRDPMRICTMKSKSTDRLLDLGSSFRIGHTVPTPVFARAVEAINSSFQTTHTSIGYNGNGAGRLALINGEVDYYITSAKHGRYIEQNGGQCIYKLSSGKNSDGLDSIQDLDPKNRYLTLGYDTVWLAKNMSNEQVSMITTVLEDAHNNCDSAIGRYSDCGETLSVDFDLPRETILSSWEQSVATMRTK